MDLCCGIFCTIIFVIFLLHCLFEVHYFLRMCLVLIIARFMKKRAHILDQTDVKGEKTRVLFRDLRRFDPSTI